MDHSPRLTPRTKGAQIAPEGPSPLITGQDEPTRAPADRVAPYETAPGNTSASSVEYMVKYAGRAKFKDNILLYLKMLVPIGIASVYLFAMFAVISWAVPNKLCDTSAMEFSVRLVIISKSF